MEKLIKSPLFYVGDKFKIFNQIKCVFPKNINGYYEPFAGGGSSFLNVKSNFKKLNDLNKVVTELHLWLKDAKKTEEYFFKRIRRLEDKYNLSSSWRKNIIPKELKTKFPKTYFAHFNKEGFNKMRTDFNSENKKDYYKLYLLIIYGFNRMIRFNSKGDFNVPCGNVDFNENVFNSLKDFFLLSEVEDNKFYSLNYKEFVLEQTFLENDFIYFDPPYLITNSEYNKMWNENNEIELLELLDHLNKKNIKWAISNLIENNGNMNSLFYDWMIQYKVIEIKSNYISFNNNLLKNNREVLVTNYENKSKEEKA